MVTIVFAHPWHGSFNYAILETTIEKLKKTKTAYQVIDLNKDQFNPVMLESELALFSKGQHRDPLVSKYQSMLAVTSEIIFIFPVWWYDTPAILKGFVDKVMLKGFSYTESSLGLTGKLTHIKRAKVITTSQAPRWYLQLFAGDAIKKTFINATLKSVGIKNVTWLHCGEVTKGSKKDKTKREKFLLTVARAI